MDRRLLTPTVLLALLLIAASSLAQESGTNTAEKTLTADRLITFNGTVKEASGLPKIGSFPITFRLYAAQEGGEPLWTENQSVQTGDQGKYTVLLGSAAKDGLPLEVFSSGKAQWLGVQVEGQDEEARVLLVAVPYALKAADADTVGGKPISSFVLQSDLPKVAETIRPLILAIGPNTGSVPGGFSVGSNEKLFPRTPGSGVGSRIGGQGLLGLEGGSPLFNTLYGSASGSSITSGHDNSFFGSNAGYSNTTGFQNSFFGAGAGLSNTTGICNSFFGLGAGIYATTGSCNSFFGQWTGQVNEGNYNSFFGHLAGALNTTGSLNSVFGDSAGLRLTTGSSNALFGYYAGQANSTGSLNSFFGGNAGYNNTTGQQNAFFGQAAGLSNTVENNNTFLGDASDGFPGITNATALGYSAKVTQSNSLVLGSINGVNGATASTNVGIGTTAPKATLDVIGPIYSSAWGPLTGSGLALLYDGYTGLLLSYDSNADHALDFAFRASTIDFRTGYWGNTSAMYVNPQGSIGVGTKTPQQKLHVVGGVLADGYSTPSDARLKQDIKPLAYGLDEILHLRPVSFYWKDRDDSKLNLGLIAQEVATVVPEIVEKSKDEAGTMGMNYSALIPVLIKAVQEQQTVIEGQRAFIQEQKSMNQNQKTALELKNDEIAALNARLAVLEQLVDRLAKQGNEK
jgi:hypothetical protein